MHEEFNIRELTDRDDAAFIEVATLFQSMYDYMEAHGLIIELAADGAKKWIEGIKKGLGRFGVIYIASQGENIKGFAHGSIRLTPDYLGNKKVGVITHVFVEKEMRGIGVGEKLVKGLETWFAAKQVHSVELQVLSANKPGIDFWEKLGYPAELLQNRKMGNKL